MASLLPCTCRAILRQAVSSPALKSPRAIPRKHFSLQAVQRYPRQATPFRASTSQLPNEDSAASTASEPWYMSESPIASTSTQSTPSPLEAPLPPVALPPYLHPLWIHLFESPFLDQGSIKLIDARAAELGSMNDGDMDASVTSWVDWTIVASLRSGRERGIRGASDGVKSAMLQSLAIFDEPALDPSASAPKRRRNKRKILVEGLDVAEPQWCLVDGGKAIVHVMTADARNNWDVEGVATAFSENKLKPEAIETLQSRADIQTAREDAQ